LKAASKVAGGDSGLAVNKGRVMNPFARFNVGGMQQPSKNLDASQHGTSQHGISLGSSQHGKKGDSLTQGPAIAMAKNLAGLNQFRLNTFVRKRSTDTWSQEDQASQKEDVQVESVAFDQTSTKVAVEIEPELASGTIERESEATTAQRDE
jgi:hypothetical protein